MKKHLVLLLLLFTVACGGIRPPKPPQPPQPPPPAQVTITVVDGNTQAALMDVIVRCTALSAEPAPTDGFGRTWLFGTTGIQTNCTFQREGYNDQTASYLPGVDSEETAWMNAVLPAHSFSRNARNGRLRIQDGGFQDNNGYVNPLYAHAGNFPSVYVRIKDKVLAQFDKVADAGYQGLRMWYTLGCGINTATQGCAGQYWGGHEFGPEVTPNYWDVVKEMGLELIKRGLRAVVSQGDINQIPDRRAYMERMVQVDNEVGGFIDFIDGGNEAWQTGEPDPNALASFIGHYKNFGGQGLTSTTSGTNESKAEIDRWGIPPSDVFDVHTFRDGHNWDKTRHIRSIRLEAKPRLAFGIGSEPPGNGTLVSVTANKHELDNEAVPMLAASSMLARQAFVWFSGEGVKLDKGLETEAGFWTTPTTVDRMPKNVMSYDLFIHGGQTWASVRVIAAEGEGRVDCRLNGDGRFFCTLDGPPGTYPFRVDRPFVGQLCDPDAACEDVHGNPGDRLTVTFQRGRTLSGVAQ